jgi:alkaline phosphatase
MVNLFQANAAMHETMAFDRAIEKALSMVDIDETLIIVTADHGHTMSMSGYQTRGSDIRGKTDIIIIYSTGCLWHWNLT